MGSKHIAQETFDEAVQENIAEFEMDPEEAVREAVQQFESQGTARPPGGRSLCKVGHGSLVLWRGYGRKTTLSQTAKRGLMNKMEVFSRS